MKNKLAAFFIMHFGFLVYSSYAILGKLASKENFLSLKFILYYSVAIFILAVYAFLWQKVLKVFSLSVAASNKAVTIIWGIVFGHFIFNECIKPTMIAGAFIIFCGILLLNLQGSKDGDSRK